MRPSNVMCGQPSFSQVSCHILTNQWNANVTHKQLSIRVEGNNIITRLTLSICLSAINSSGDFFILETSLSKYGLVQLYKVVFLVNSKQGLQLQKDKLCYKRILINANIAIHSYYCFSRIVGGGGSDSNLYFSKNILSLHLMFCMFQWQVYKSNISSCVSIGMRYNILTV